MQRLSLDDAMPPAEVVRHSPRTGRWRLAIPGLDGDELLARRVEKRLLALPGVRSARADPRSGRVLVVARAGALDSRVEELSARRPRAHTSPRRPRRARGEPEPPWHALSVEETLARLGSSSAGLSPDEAQARLRAFGANESNGTRERSRLALLAEQLANLPSALLLGASAVSTALGEFLDVGAILGVLGLNVSIGYAIERSNQQLLASWRRAEAGEVDVLRGGRPARVSTSELVPGDVALLRAGDVVPADGRVVEAHRLACDEAALTGESEPARKQVEPVAEDAPLAERASMVFAATAVTGGRARVVISATGAATEMARVRQLVERSVAPEAPLARRLARLSRRVAGVALGSAGVSALAGLAHGRAPRELLRGAVALGLAALPEGLPVTSTAALVRSMRRMRHDGMVVRRLSSAETLGGVTVICCDKTGTLTLNDMRLELAVIGERQIAAGDLRADPARLFDDPPTLLLAAALLNSDVDVSWRAHQILGISGSSTEKALVLAAHAAGLDGEALRVELPRRALYERARDHRYVVSLHDSPRGRVAFVKGAPDEVLALSAHDGSGAPLDDAARRRVLDENERLAADGLRVLAVAWRPPAAAAAGARDRFRYLGLVALRDPLRPGAAEAIRGARAAGIRTVILTGDQRRTAEAIARRVGLGGETIDGAEAARLAAARDPASRARLAGISVVARVSPADKLAVVEALRRAGEIVAMAGDGINDGPALKVADVGIAVGPRATDLARHVADVVLQTEDLQSILAAVGEGRIVQDNLRRAVRFLFATNSSELLLMVGAALVGARDPLTPIQLLFINLLTDTLPALALASEPGDRSVLKRPPARPDAPILSRAMLRGVARDGLLMAAVGAAAGLVGGPPLAFSALAGVQLAYTLRCRAPDAPPNPRLSAIVAGTASAQALALALPVTRAFLQLAGSPLATLLAFAAAFALPLVAGRLGEAELVVGGATRREPVLQEVANQ